MFFADALLPSYQPTSDGFPKLLDLPWGGTTDHIVSPGVPSCFLMPSIAEM
jgi:hypothetical protein